MHEFLVNRDLLTGLATLSSVCTLNYFIFYGEWCFISQRQIFPLFLLYLALKYNDELEAKVLADEDLEKIPCPEEGFHEQPQEDHEAMAVQDEKEEIVPEEIKFLRNTIEHSRHFISMVGCPQWQLLAMEIVGEAILLIEMQQ